MKRTSDGPAATWSITAAVDLGERTYRVFLERDGVEAVARVGAGWGSRSSGYEFSLCVERVQPASVRDDVEAYLLANESAVESALREAA